MGVICTGGLSWVAARRHRWAAIIANPHAIAPEAANQRQFKRGGKSLEAGKRVVCAAQPGHGVEGKRQQSIAVAEHDEKVFVEQAKMWAWTDQP